MLVSEAIARWLGTSGDSVLFGFMGNTNMLLISTFMGLDSCRYVAAANEGGALCMASGYAQVTGKLGIVTVIKGPGVTNTITALSDASAARVPILLLAADTATSVKDDLQNLPQRDLVLPTGAGFEQMRTPKTALEDLREARRRAIAEARPILLNIPSDFWEAETDYAPPDGYPTLLGRTCPDLDALDAAVGVIVSARRPIILAGRGASSPASREAILRLSTRLGAPVATTLRAKGLFTGVPGSLGLFGELASDKTSEAIALADCIVTFGTSLNFRTTDSGGLLRGKAVVQCDTDRRAIGKGANVIAGVVGDAGAIADGIVECLDRVEAKPSSFLAEVESLSVPSPSPSSTKPRMTGTVDFVDALRTVESSVPSDRVLTVDNGRFMYATYKSISVPTPQSYVHTASVGSIGLGLGHAIGAAIGAHGRPTLLVTGDGGFMNSGIAEFHTAVTAGVDLIVVVMNDSALGAEYRRMVARGMDPSPSMYQRPSFAAVAEALGGQGFCVTDEESLREVPNVIANRRAPLLIDIRLDPAAVSKEAVTEYAK